VAQGKCRALDLARTRELPFGATALGADEQPLPIEGYMYRLNIGQTGGGGSNTQRGMHGVNGAPTFPRVLRSQSHLTN